MPFQFYPIDSILLILHVSVTQTLIRNIVWGQFISPSSSRCFLCSSTQNFVKQLTVSRWNLVCPGWRSVDAKGKDRCGKTLLQRSWDAGLVSWRIGFWGPTSTDIPQKWGVQRIHCFKRGPLIQPFVSICRHMMVKWSFYHPLWLKLLLLLLVSVSCCSFFSSTHNLWRQLIRHFSTRPREICSLPSQTSEANWVDIRCEKLWFSFDKVETNILRCEKTQQDNKHDMKWLNIALHKHLQVYCQPFFLVASWETWIFRPAMSDAVSPYNLWCRSLRHTRNMPGGGFGFGGLGEGWWLGCTGCTDVKYCNICSTDSSDVNLSERGMENDLNPFI